MTSRAEVRVGIIGVGFGQHVLVPAVCSCERARVVAIAASSADRARRAAERLDIPRAYGGWRALLDDEALDAVCIAVPPALQPAVAEAAAVAGKHLFCEKPVGGDTAAVERLLSAARAAGVVHAVDFEFRELAAWQEARRVIAEGTLGRLRHVALSWRVETRAWRDGGQGWKLRESEGGGALNLFASHSLDYLEWLFGPVGRVAARLAPAGAAADARVDAWLERSDGLPITLSIAADAFLGSGHRLEVYGEEGTLVLENSTGDYVSGFTVAVGTRESGAFRRIERAAETMDGDGRIVAVGRLFRRFADAILEDGAVRPNLEDGLRVQRLMDKVRAAHRLGTWQS